MVSNLGLFMNKTFKNIDIYILCSNTCSFVCEETKLGLWSTSVINYEGMVNYSRGRSHFTFPPAMPKY